MQNIMFASPDLERNFRKVCDSPHEVSGFLFLTGRTLKGLDRRRIKSALHRPRYPSINFITSWVLIPNEAKNPQTSWTTSLNCFRLMEAARFTANSLQCWETFHFHTHPSGTAAPSDQDIKFWLKYCKSAETKLYSWHEAAIVTRQYFYVQGYGLKLDKRINQYSLDRSLFWSWNDSRLRDYKREVFG